jgi:hypothetical protein
MTRTLSPSAAFEEAPVRERVRRVARSGRRLVRRIANNEATGTRTQWIFSIVNIVVRNCLSVGIPTWIRQVLAAALVPLLAGLADGTLATINVLAIGIPMVATLAGAIADRRDGAATRWTMRARTANLVFGCAAIAVAAAAGRLGAGCAACVATWVYCVLRDGVQTCVTNPDETRGVHLGALAAASAAYAGNQFGVSRGMSLQGSPSGAAAAGMIAERAFKDVVCAAWNTFGESVDDVLQLVLRSRGQGRPIRASLRFAWPGARQWTDKLLRMNAARGTIFIGTLLLLNVLDVFLERRGVPAATRSLCADVAFGVLFGIGTLSRVVQGDGQRFAEPIDASRRAPRTSPGRPKIALPTCRLILAPQPPKPCRELRWSRHTQMPVS